MSSAADQVPMAEGRKPDVDGDEDEAVGSTSASASLSPSSSSAEVAGPASSSWRSVST